MSIKIKLPGPDTYFNESKEFKNLSWKFGPPSTMQYKNMVFMPGSWSYFYDDYDSVIVSFADEDNEIIARLIL